MPGLQVLLQQLPPIIQHSIATLVSPLSRHGTFYFVRSCTYGFHSCSHLGMGVRGICFLKVISNPDYGWTFIRSCRTDPNLYCDAMLSVIQLICHTAQTRRPRAPERCHVLIVRAGRWHKRNHNHGFDEIYAPVTLHSERVGGSLAIYTTRA